MNTLLDWITAFPLFGLLLTLLTFYCGQRLYIASGRNAWLQPVVASMVLVILVLVLADIPYERYYRSAEMLHLLLGPATVALAVPLFLHARRIRALLLPILLTLITGSVLTVGIAVGVLWLMGGSESSLLTITTKSITTPIAMVVSEKLGGIAPLAAVIVMVTGALGAVVGIPIMEKLGFRDKAVQGVTLGLTAHAIGTTRALEEDEECGAFAAFAMGTTGVLTALLLPIIVSLWR
ncbi:MAG: LrgB family protein [Gammaproteobacteria bacterium]|nr:LrgB family protein [Gammaproteobacteria bacterium]